MLLVLGIPSILGHQGIIPNQPNVQMISAVPKRVNGTEWLVGTLLFLWLWRLDAYCGVSVTEILHSHFPNSVLNFSDTCESCNRGKILLNIITNRWMWRAPDLWILCLSYLLSLYFPFFFSRKPPSHSLRLIHVALPLFQTEQQRARKRLIPCM